jgi:site-specific DNA-methyltransferase (adenine-specific)
MNPYYDDGKGIVIYHGDCREILPQLPNAETVIVDPVWPNSKAGLIGQERATELFAETVPLLNCDRMAVHIGCDTPPSFLNPVKLPFFRVCWLEMVRPNYVGRLMNGSDVAYLFGKVPLSKPGQHVIPGRYLATDSNGKESAHPCPRKLSHVKWLVRWWSEPTDTILDPFMGGGTTLRAAKDRNRKAVGIEIEEEFCEIAAHYLAQEVLQL